MNKTITLLLCCVAITLFACATPTTTPTNEQQVPQEENTPQEEQTTQEPTTPQAPEPMRTMDSAVRSLVEKGSSRTNYEFTYAKLSEGRADTKYFVRGDYVRVEPRTSNTRTINSIDTVYLDLQNRLAVGYCVRGSNNICQDRTKIADLEFDDYYVELSHEVIQRLDNGERVQTVSYKSQTADVVQAFLDGQEATLTINQFQGLPLLVEYADGTGFEYRDISFGGVSEEEVTPPAGW